MKKEFTTYEQASAVKDLDFDEPCLGFYLTNDKRFYFNDGLDDGATQEDYSINSELQTGFVAAPLKSQLLRWFRKNHGLYSSIIPKKSYPDNHVTGIEWHVEICGGDGIDIGPDGTYTFGEAEDACIDKLIEILKHKS